MKWVAFFRNVNLGQPKSPTRAQLEAAFREAGAEAAASVIIHGTRLFSFARGVVAERVGTWVELEGESPYMVLVAGVQEARRLPTRPEDEGLFGIERLKVPRSQIPAVTHVDGSARIQTVHASTHPRFHALLRGFFAATGCPVLVNTSFNVRGEPIVPTPADAFRCFMGTEIETLVLGNCLLQKEDQPAHLKSHYAAELSPD